MDKITTFQNFLVNQSAQISIWDFVINQFLVAIMAWILGQIYIKYGRSLSNRRLFAKNFVLMAVITMFIIAVVKSSLALSLGLVGALSIVRFRTAVKEPEELVYLFLTIGIGLGLGADQRLITIVSFLIAISTIYFNHFFEKQSINYNLHLTIIGKNNKKVSFEKIVKILEKFCDVVNLNRIDEDKQIIEAVFLVDFKDADKFNKCKNELRKIDPSVKITFLDNQLLI
jgi:Domain of unknown function (DUF4956)